MNLLQKIWGVSKDKAAAADLSPEDSQKASYNTARHKSLHHTACMAPSVNMIFSEDGSVKVCCHNRENLLGFYPDKSVHEIWHGEDAVLFRQKMKEFKFLSGCWVCTNDYNRGSFDAMPSRHFDTLPQHSYPTMMEFLLNNTCNLECVMCSGELSSSIRTNREKLPLQKSPYDNKFISDLEEFIPYLKETRFSSSGEAFLIDLNYKLWQLLIDRNPECMIVVQTNGTIMNGKVRDFLERGNFKIGVSLDSLKKEVFESIRINASFERIMENIKYFSSYSKERGQVLTISTCVMRQNWQELPDFIDFCNNIGALATFHKVITPLEFALQNLPVSDLQHIYDTLSAYEFTSHTPLQKTNIDHYAYFLSVIQSWLLSAGDGHTGSSVWQDMNVSELLTDFLSRLKKYVYQEDMLEKNKEQLLINCEKKITDVLELLHEEQEKKDLMIILCSTPVPSIFPAVKNLTMEKLHELSFVRVKK